MERQIAMMQREKEQDPLVEPLYRVRDVARWLHLSPRRVRSWLHGYTYRRSAEGGQSHRPPVIRGRAVEDFGDACFLDLVELRLIHELLGRGWTLQELRKDHDDIASRLGTPYPFAQRQFYISGKRLYVPFEEGGRRHLLEVRGGGQCAIEPIIKQVSDELRFERRTGRAVEWRPLKDARVVVDPFHAYGAPRVDGHNVKTSLVYAMFQAEDGRVDVVAKWFQLAPEEVYDAVRFEESLQAA